MNGLIYQKNVFQNQEEVTEICSPLECTNAVMNTWDYVGQDYELLSYKQTRASMSYFIYNLALIPKYNFFHSHLKKKNKYL